MNLPNQFYQHLVKCKYSTKKRLVILGFIIAIVLLLHWDYQIQDQYQTIQSAKAELLYYIHQNEEECREYKIKQLEPTLVSTSIVSEKDSKKPECLNLLSNISNGEWVLKIKQDSQLNEEIRQSHINYRKTVGIPIEPWQYNFQCGYNVLQPKISRTWPQVGSFCDPESLKPCCNNIYRGECVTVTTRQKCDCSGCVDTRKYKDARQADWKVHDKRCAWVDYTPLEACTVLNQVPTDSAAARFHFVGDSLIRNMFMGLEMIMAPGGNIQKSCISKELQKLCQGENMFVLRPCHDLAAAHSLDALNTFDGLLCNGKQNFHMQYHNIAVESQGDAFLQLVMDLSGKPGNFLTVGVGLHFGLNHHKVINNFLKPALDFLQQSKSTWPRFMWVHPLSIGLLKPPTYISTQGTEATDVYITNMNKFLGQYQIPWFDFRNITKNVHSYDGTHYGSGVNIMKGQIFLNYIATLS